MLLSKLPSAYLDPQTRGAVKHAQITGPATLKGGVGQTAVAWFALARVVVLLEEHVKGKDAARLISAQPTAAKFRVD